MTTLTVAPVIVSGYRTKITVTVTSPPVDSIMNLIRIRADGTSEPVLGAVDVAAVSGVWEDPAVDIAQPVTYRATVDDGTATESSPLTVTGPTDSRGRALPLVSDPHIGANVPVVLLEGSDDLEYASRTVAVDVQMRHDRVVIGDVEGTPRRQLQFLTTTAGDSAALSALFQAGRPMLLRVPDVDLWSGWFDLIGGRSLKRISTKQSAPERVHQLGDCETLLTPGDVMTRPPGDTLGDLDAAVGDGTTGTLGAIAAAWATLGEIAAADLQAI